MVEGVCSVEGITDGPVATTKADGTVEIKRKATLEGKIFGLAEKNILTNKSAEILHQHRYLGNEALHELGVPSRDELALAVDILEHVLENIYEIPQKALELKSKVNSRKSKT